MSEPLPDHYLDRKTPPRASEEISSPSWALWDRIDCFLARGGGDLRSRELLIEANSLLMAHERERMVWIDRMDRIFRKYFDEK